MWASALTPVEILPPVIIYFYSFARLYGKAPSPNILLKHLSIFSISALLIIPIVSSSYFVENNLVFFTLYHNFYRVVFTFITAMLYFIYPVLIIRMLGSCYGMKRNHFRECFRLTPPKLKIIWLLNLLLFINGLIFLAELFVSIYFIDYNMYIDYTNTLLLLSLSYIFTYIFIQNPKIIHFEKNKVGIKSFSKYEKSGLNETEAQDYIKKMNQLMEKDKPFINSNYSLNDLSESLNLPNHIISEVLNGLIKQGFYDYINNYRIEEFKELLKNPDNQDEKILNLAFDAGFNSKTAFNNAFKKVTGITPSAYRKSLKKYSV